MHSTACGAATTVNSTSNSNYENKTDGLKMVHHNDDAMNKIPLKSASGADDEEKNGGEFVHDTATAEEARREQMRENILKWMKKLTIVLICFIGIALISYVVISLCFSDWSKHKNTNSKNSSTLNNSAPNMNSSQDTNTLSAAILPLRTIPLNYTETPVINKDATKYTTSPPLPPTPPTTTNTAPSDEHSSIQNASETINLDSFTTTSTTTSTSTSSTQRSTSTDTDATPTEDMLLNTHPLLDSPPTLAKNFSSTLKSFKHAAVSSDKEVCSRIGSAIMQQKGSAVDAAIAALMCNGLVSMQSMGLGGGMFMNIFIKEANQAYTIDAREVAPFAAYQEMFAGKSEKSHSGSLSIGVPGELMGYYRAHERFGKLPWKTLVEPTIKICEDGFHITDHVKMSISEREDYLRNNTYFYNMFFNNTTGNVLPLGSKIKPHAQLCSTYKLLAENGPLDFYNGTLSKLVAEDLKDVGSIVTAYDLESYTADLMNSITMQLGDDILYVPPPVSSGTVVANILSILEGYNFTAANIQEPEHLALTIHRIVEAFKFGYAKRWELGDMRFNDVRDLISKLTNPEHAATIRSRINDSYVHMSLNDYDAQFLGVDDEGTSHLSVLAPNGDAVSVTSSINFYFGSGRFGKRTGIIFNSAMNDFSIEGEPNLFNLPPAPSNYVDARKRPMSSMSPLILASPEGEVRMVIGSSGGSKIIASVTEVISRILWFKQNIKQAIDAPRFYHQLVPNLLEYEKDGLSQNVVDILRSKGQILKPTTEMGTVVNAIVKNATAIYANADYRKRGDVAGF